jgi:hypothetical protein
MDKKRATGSPSPEALSRWENEGGAPAHQPKRLKRPRDPVQLGKPIGDILTGQTKDRARTPEQEGKNVHAVRAGRLGGSKGGAARAAALTPKERPASAKKAAAARWKKSL